MIKGGGQEMQENFYLLHNFQENGPEII